MSETRQKPSVVVIGGGTGTYNLLQGLKRYADDISITKIVSMADSGGSTGRLRDEFGQLPVGDARMGLAALAADIDADHQLLRELLQYRFDKGAGLAGHNFGNLLLVALTDMLGSEAKAIQAAGRILRVRGRVLPVTEASCNLVATYDDGVTVVGEHDIDEPPSEREAHRIVSLTLDTPALATTEVVTALQRADLIVVGPGDLYASLLAVCVVGGVAEAIASSPGKFLYVTNLMSRPGQTRGMAVSDYLTALTDVIGRQPDAVLINTTALPDEVLAKYEREGDRPVVDDLDDAVTAIRGDYLETEAVQTKSGDVLKRALIRHDGHKLAAAILEYLSQ